MNFDLYIHTNKKNDLPAKIGKYSFESINKGLNTIILYIEDFDIIINKDKNTFYRKKNKCQLNINSSQSFFILRFFAPYYHKFNNNNSNKKKWILIIDPDIFCLKSISSLNEYIEKAEKEDKYIIANNYLSSFMLINTDKLCWEPENLINDVFVKHENFDNYMLLEKYKGKVINIPEFFNHYDKLTSQTLCLHTSLTVSQPWKTGLPYLKHDLHNIPYNPNDNNIMYFKKHNNFLIEQKFFELMKLAIDNNYVSKEDINNSLLLEGLRKDYELFLK